MKFKSVGCQSISDFLLISFFEPIRELVDCSFEEQKLSTDFCPLTWLEVGENGVSVKTRMPWISDQRVRIAVPRKGNEAFIPVGNRYHNRQVGCCGSAAPPKTKMALLQVTSLSLIERLPAKLRQMDEFVVQCEVGKLFDAT